VTSVASDDWSPYVTDCKCGHARASHYWDVKGSGNCLARGCECQRYRQPEEKKTKGVFDEAAPFDLVVRKELDTDPDIQLPFMRCDS